MLTQILHYVNNNPSKIILATGDTCQNEPIVTLTNTQDQDEYIMECVTQMFPNYIKLTENKRLKSQEDKDKLKKLKQEIDENKDKLNDKKFIRKLLKTYFKFTNEITTTKNIAYRNDIADTVSRTVRKLLNKQGEYEVGEFLSCKLYNKQTGSILTKSGERKDKSNLRLNKNCKFEIIAIEADNITIKYNLPDLVPSATLDALEDQFTILATEKDYTMIVYEYIIKVQINKIRTLFNHSYCKTGHSLQGITIAEPTTIFDWEMPYVSLKWIWVAVTRTMNMNDVLIYNGKSPEFNETVMNKFFELKIKDYQIQDTKAKRTLDSKNYVNPEWFKQFLVSPCPKCNNTYNMHHDKYRFYADITANRL